MSQITPKKFFDKAMVAILISAVAVAFTGIQTFYPFFHSSTIHIQDTQQGQMPLISTKFDVTQYRFEVVHPEITLTTQETQPPAMCTLVSAIYLDGHKAQSSANLTEVYGKGQSAGLYTWAWTSNGDMFTDRLGSTMYVNTTWANSCYGQYGMIGNFSQWTFTFNLRGTFEV